MIVTSGQPIPTAYRSGPFEFNEGARSTAQKIAAFIGTAIAVAVSFLLLPVEAAAVICGTLAVLVSTTCCLESEIPESQQRWYHPVIYAVPRAVNWFFPVANPGPRAEVGEGHHQQVGDGEIHPDISRRRYFMVEQNRVLPETFQRRAPVGNR